MTYPLPSDRNITEISTLVTYTNEITNYYWGILMLVAIFVIMFFIFKAYTSARNFAASIWIITLIAVLFRILEVISDGVLITLIIMCIASIPVLILERGE